MIESPSGVKRAEVRAPARNVTGTNLGAAADVAAPLAPPNTQIDAPITIVATTTAAITASVRLVRTNAASGSGPCVARSTALQRSAEARSLALCHRPSGSFDRHLVTTRSTLAGTGTRVESAGGSCVRIDAATAA